MLYASDGAYHAWVFMVGPKALALAAGALFVWLAAWPALPAPLTLGAVGMLQALSFSQVATDDLIRYWGIADGFALGAGYSVTAGVPGSADFYLVDLPFFPLTLGASFAALGHRFAAAHAPLVVANLALPFVFFALARAAGAPRAWSCALALIVISLPQYQVYTLGAAQPDALWAVVLGTQLLLVLRLDRDTAHQPRLWAALGVVSAAVVLTRPEGAIYTGLLFLGLLWRQRRAPRGVLLAGAIGALPAAIFSVALHAQFDVWWPAGGWANVARPRYVLANVALIVRRNLPAYAEALGAPAPVFSGPLVAALLAAAMVVGFLLLWHRFPGARGLPLAVAVNLAVILTSPTDLGADRLGPATLFRHVSVTVPALIAPLALLWRGSRRVRRSRARAGTLGVLAAGVLALEMIALGSTAARIGNGQATVLTSDPYVNIADMWRMDDALPMLPFRPGPGRGTEIDPTFDYMGFRGRLFAAARPYDLHVSDAGRAYMLAAMVFGATGLMSAALARPRDERAATAT